MGKKSRKKIDTSIKKMKKQKKKKIWELGRNSIMATISFLLFGLFTFLNVYFYLFFSKSTPAFVGGEITQFGDIELSYNTHQRWDISPLCGCYEKSSSHDWRGITFTAEKVIIERYGSSGPFTNYFITSAFPDSINWFPNSLIRFNGTFYKILKPEKFNFYIEMLEKNTLPSPLKIIEKKHFGAEKMLHFITNKELNIVILGKYPLGCWIPAKDSIVSLEYYRGKNINNDYNAGIIKESYTDYSDEFAKKEVDKEKLDTEEFAELVRNMDLPLGDFLGPKLVLWSYGNSFISNGEDIVSFEAYNNTNKNVINVILLEGPFSFRIACASLYDNNKEEIMKRIKNSKKGLITDIRDKGKVRVIIENPLTQASNFKEMYNRMKEGDVVWMTNLPTKKEKENTGNNDWRSGFSGMNFRLPPIPPNEGFNIFGSINNLKLKSGMGKIMIGGRAFDVNAPSIIEFRNLKTLRLEDKDKPIPVPIQLDHLNNKAKFQLQGTAEVSINEESLNIKADKYKYLCNYILLILQLLSVIVGSITIIMQRRNTPE